MGKFIPKTYRKQAITLRIDEKMLAQIDLLSAKHGMSRSDCNNCINKETFHCSDGTINRTAVYYINEFLSKLSSSLTSVIYKVRYIIYRVLYILRSVFASS